MHKSKSIQENAAFEVSLKIILKNKWGEILLLKMPKKSSMPGYYDFIGGRIREKEIKSPFRKLIEREVREEIGKEARYKLKETPVAIGRHYYFSRREKKVKYIFWVFFEAQYKGGRVRTSTEHDGYKWTEVNRHNFKRYFIKGPLEGMGNYLLKMFVDPV